MDVSNFFDYRNAASSGEEKTDTWIFLPNAGEADWQRIIALSSLITFQPGEILVREGDGHQAFYVVARGELEVVALRRRRKAQRLALIPEGSVFGEQAFFDGRPRSATVRALGEGELLELTRDNFEILAAQDPPLARDILFDLGRILSARLRRMTTGGER